MNQNKEKTIEVWCEWLNLQKPELIGYLFATPGRGKEIFSFEYDDNWLKRFDARILDPSLQLFKGRQYAAENQPNFGVFLDSSPDRWGRMLIRRREAFLAKTEKRAIRPLFESDFLLGVYDGLRPGALRFKLDPSGPFLDDNEQFASPPWASLRELESASINIEKDNSEKEPEYKKWLQMLIAPGGSLGGARPKASVKDELGDLWIAKFPSRMDEFDVGAWEKVLHDLANKVGIETAPSQLRRLGKRYHTFLTKRFDRGSDGKRLHFSSAMSLLQRNDGDDYSSGVSYLDLAQFIIQHGADPNADLKKLWTRIVFNICTSNADDHLRNHAFLLDIKGWVLSPAFDMNPDPYANGLKLNISMDDNSQDLNLALEVAEYFRVKKAAAAKIVDSVRTEVGKWKETANALGLEKSEIELLSPAFRV